MGLIFALVLIALSFLAPMLSRDIRRGPVHVLLTIWFMTALHHGVSLYGANWGGIIGATADAYTFQTKAALLAAGDGAIPFSLGAQSYVWFLAHLYRLCGDSLLLGQAVSVLAFTISLVFLLKIKRLIGPAGYDAAIVLLFALEPAILLWTSVTLRESFQILFLLMGIYFGITARTTGNRLGIGLSLMSLSLLAILQNGLMLYAPFLVVLLLVWHFSAVSTTRRSDRAVKWLTRSMLFFAVVLVGGVVLMSLPGFGVLKALQSGSLLEYFEAYRLRSAAVVGGSTYGGVIDGHSVGAFLLSVLSMLSHYFFGPYPWELKSAVDIPALLSSLLRSLLLVFAVRAWLQSEGAEKNRRAFLLVAFLSLECLWAAGTTNYGTAMRHHMVAYGLVVAMGTPGLMRWIKSMIKPVASVQGGDESVDVNNNPRRLRVGK